MRETKQPAVADIADIIHDFRVCHEESTQGLWIRGKTTHETVAVQVEKEPYHVAHFRHANDAQFCDVAHAHALRLCDELEKAHARIAELEAELAHLRASAPTPSNPGELEPATPWYPDNSGEWVEVPEDLKKKPVELSPRSLIQILQKKEREDQKFTSGLERAYFWPWDRKSADPFRIVAYKVVKP